MTKKRHLYQSMHPFDAYPFEAFFNGSWQIVELIRVEDGIMTMHFLDDQYLIEERRPFSKLRVRSRQATLIDCTCFLRPGIDICVLSSSQNSEGSDGENQEPVWMDAKISSIERNPHESKCSLGLAQISILQRLERDPMEDRYYRWNFSEDCSSLQKTKVFLGRFSSDLSWLIVTSVLKQIAFDVRSFQNKIFYQVLGGDDDSDSINSDNHLNAVNFKIDEGITTSVLFKFTPADTIEACSNCDEYENEPSFSDVMDLRRSKRRNVQPERFLGCDFIPDKCNNWTRIGAYRTAKLKEDEEEMFLPLSCLFSKSENVSGEHTIEGETTDLLECRSKTLQCKSKPKPRELSTSVANQIERQNQLAIVPVLDETNPVAHEEFYLHIKDCKNYTEEIDEICSRYYASKCNRALPRKKLSDFEDMFESRWAGRALNKKVPSKRYRSMCSKGEDYSEPLTYRRTTLSAGAYSKLINSYMKNIDSTMTKEEPNIVDQWSMFKSEKCSEQKEMEMDDSSVQDDGESSENEMLWTEMELSMASAYLDEKEGPKTGGSIEIGRKSCQDCQHDYILREEIGILCRLCGFVSTEIKYVSAPFMPNKIWTVENKICGDEDFEHKGDEDEGLDLVCNQSSSETPLSEINDNVWALIPELRTKLHAHQKKAFEFLWHNIAGSLDPALMEEASKHTGGCAISHSPGAGKTFLIIAFLVSYLKLFPGKRPLVLAPKTTLYTWYKEFIKWEIPIPVHLIHGRRTYRVFRQNQARIPGVQKPSQDVMHVIDCLEKIHKWHAQPSVLVMGYTSFLTLIREDSKFAHRKYMAKVLRESPGILILDEGHNPRSTKSRLRKALMKVETDLRVLLSGTLFQNNFCEYFNTLCLARPKFIYEVLKELDPKFKRKKKGAQKARHLLESRARKFFIDTIAKKIDSDIGEERMQGLNMLRNITNGFIDVYEIGNSDGLPGLQIYTLLMNPTDIQHEVLLKLHKIMASYHGYPLELELLITLASIHPSLVKTSNCVNKFFSRGELEELEKHKFNSRKGSKVMFVLNLVYRVIKKEKVLIFCHNIAPITLFVELFESVFRWQKGREILVLTGEQELFERGRIMDRFEEPEGASRILLASITACAEGISLTAASRVILLDSEWNPSKTKQAIARAFRPGQQKVVYVYQLLAANTLETGKYNRTTWKEWVSDMIFSDAFVEDPSRWQAEKIEDDILREMVEEDRVKSFHMIMKNEKASTG
ncbi:SNF2_N domain-containing protein/Helicase_C domain-containing protein [Cephalotus follicularis]|uniref:SNF2_N domain-containing protein/Helicase_C domain-containing protein n=1 Tax=Cephalotus follicularis TaxID=3775 RepID=A0A1Q3CU86_CEPFO|nr:SNF2_N domain-containing protein/Helicase_C domain-containing protein [Cephalotus follicularis]